MRMRMPVLLLTLAALLGANAQPAKANVFDTFAAIVNDPLKLGKLSDTVLEVLAQIEPLMGKSNAIAQQRLDQVQQIVDLAIKGGTAVEAKAISDLLSLESKIMNDVNTVIFRARCAAIETLNGTAQQAIKQALATLAKSQPTGTILGFPFFRLKFSDVVLPPPDKAYGLAKAEMETNLEKLTEASNAYEILSAYADLELVAESTRCYYLDKPNEITFVREQMQLELKQLPWTTVVSVDPDFVGSAR